MATERVDKRQVRQLLVEMIVGGVSLEVVDALRSAAAASITLHCLLAEAVTSAVNTLRSVLPAVACGVIFDVCVLLMKIFITIVATVVNFLV